MGKLNISPSVLGCIGAASPQVQAMQRAYVEHQNWRTQCFMLGATATQVDSFEESVRGSMYPFDAVRDLALAALQRDEPMPENVDQAIEAAQREIVRRLLG
jgi:hypothetical protein